MPTNELTPDLKKLVDFVTKSAETDNESFCLITFSEDCGILSLIPENEITLGTKRAIIATAITAMLNSPENFPEFEQLLHEVAFSLKTEMGTNATGNC